MSLSNLTPVAERKQALLCVVVFVLSEFLGRHIKTYKEKHIQDSGDDAGHESDVAFRRN